MAIQTKISKESGWRLYLRTIIGRSYPRTVGSTRDLSWLFFEVLLPFLNVVGYVYVYRALQAPEEYVGFVVLGGAMMAYWQNILWSMSGQLYWEKESGNLSLYIISPTSMMAILLGMAIGGLLATTVRALSILILGSLVFQVTYAVTNFWLLFAVFVLTMVALYGLGMITASAFLLFNREAWHLLDLVQGPVQLVSGFFFPVKALGRGVAFAASLIPLTLGMDAIRQLAFPSGELLGFLTVRAEVITLAVLSVVYVAASFFVLRYMEKLSVRQGRITDRLA